MKIFISWSGGLSKKIAEEFRDWLPNVIQNIDPYFTPSDIEKGTRWNTDIAEVLETCDFGVFFITKDNMNSPWIHFEAGALSKLLSKAKVCPILINMQPEEIGGPLSQFQITNLNRDDLRKLLNTINESLGQGSLTGDRLNRAFDRWWPEFEGKINVSEEEDDSDASSSTQEDTLNEILRLSRIMTREKTKDTWLRRLTRSSEVKVEYEESIRAINFYNEDGSNKYQIKIDRIDSTGELLDWILQLNSKGWCDNDTLIQFLAEIESLTMAYFQKQAQGVFCPHGRSIDRVEWPID